MTNSKMQSKTKTHTHTHTPVASLCCAVPYRIWGNNERCFGVLLPVVHSVTELITRHDKPVPVIGEIAERQKETLSKTPQEWITYHSKWILFLLPTFPQQFILNRLLSAYTEKEAMIPHLDEDFLVEVAVNWTETVTLTLNWTEAFMLILNWTETAILTLNWNETAY